jgi:hydroxypyruvate isomerase
MNTSPFSSNLELMFSEVGGRVPGSGAAAGDRIRRAAQLGVRSVEIWRWRDKDLAGMRTALDETGVTIRTMCVEPFPHLVDPAVRDSFVSDVADAVAAARVLGVADLVVTAGQALEGVPGDEQHETVIGHLRAGVAELERLGGRERLLLENLNSRVDHPGTFLDSTERALEIIAAVDSPRLALLYDAYHSLVMEEDPAALFAEGRSARIAHVQLADVPGRHEPGTGEVDWARLGRALAEVGYTGTIGYEYFPTLASAESLSLSDETVSSAGCC